MRTDIFAIETPPSRQGYILPFVHDSITISQGYNGTYSHFITTVGKDERKVIQDDRFSIDFALPFSTPVRAAREGAVYFTTDRFAMVHEGMFPPENVMLTNHLYLTHDDGSFTLYSHLERGSVQVQRGEHVHQGMILARTGKSGWIGPIPHLHFAAGVFAGRKFERRTFPITFDDFRGSAEDMESGLERMVWY